MCSVSKGLWCRSIDTSLLTAAPDVKLEKKRLAILLFFIPFGIPMTFEESAGIRHWVGAIQCIFQAKNSTPSFLSGEQLIYSILYVASHRRADIAFWSLPFSTVSLDTTIFLNNSQFTFIYWNLSV